MINKTRAELQEEAVRQFAGLTPSEAVQLLDQVASDLRAQGLPAAALRIIQDGREKIAALAAS